MKNRFIALLSLPCLLCSCEVEPRYTLSRFEATHEASYQLWDNFSEDNLVVSYHKKGVGRDQYELDLSGYDKSKVGDYGVKVSLKGVEEMERTVSVQVGNRTTCNVLWIGNEYVAETVGSMAKYIHSADGSFDYSISTLTLSGSTVGDHYVNFLNGNAIYTLGECKDGTDSWSYSPLRDIPSILSGSAAYDIVILQEDNIAASLEGGYRNLGPLVKAMEAYCDGEGRKVPSFGSCLPWAYDDGVYVDNAYYDGYGNDGGAMYKGLIDNSRGIEESVDFLLPLGEIVNRLRGNESLEGYNLTADGSHLNGTLGCYAASIALGSILSGYEASRFLIEGEDGPLFGEEGEAAILEAVEESIKNPLGEQI
ncbi:MAG: DUF4886 domain-containing protein [Bacilli bacterium]|nr:DUF4886 domain-containing protein [Bacilli bacterium]